MLTLLALALPAQASGYYFADSGTRAIARGGAVVAGTDDLMAMYYNPGALTRIKQPTLNVNGWMVGQSVRFDRTDEQDCGIAATEGSADPCAFPAVENEAPPLYEPSFGFATPLGGIHPALKNTVLALGLYPPTGPAMAYPEDGAQRYTLTNALVLQAWAGPTLATQVTPWLSVGAGVQWSFLAIEQGLAAKVCLAETGCLSDDPTTDVQLDVEGRDMNQWSANVGVLIQPTPWLDIGASWQPGNTYEARGRLGVAFPDDFALANFIDATSVEDKDIAITVTLPQTVRLGAQVRPHPKVQVELAGTWTQWSALDALTITDLELNIPTTESAQGAPFNLPASVAVNDEVELPTGYTDSWSARLGGDVQVTEWARLSLGAHYETSAVPPATQGVNIVDGDKWGVGGGGTFQVGKRLALDVAAAGTFLPSRDVSDSELDQLGLFIDTQNPESGGVIDGKIVGNGAYESSLTFLGVGATWKFGKLASATP